MKSVQKKYDVTNIPSVTIIIPAYNEEKRIGRVLQEISEFILINHLDWNVIISLDGNDGTEEIIKQFSKDYPFISYNKYNGRSGKGFAIKRVVNDSRGEFTILMDADGSVRLESILRGFEFLPQFDMVIFDRYSVKENNIPLYRRFPSRGYNLLVKLFFNIGVNDTQCGYMIIKTDIAKSAFGRVTISNGFFYVPLLYYVKKSGGKIKEIPIKYEYESESKFRVLEMVLGGSISLLAFRLRHSRFYKYVPEWTKELYYRKFKWI